MIRAGVGIGQLNDRGSQQGEPHEYAGAGGDRAAARFGMGHPRGVIELMLNIKP